MVVLVNLTPNTYSNYKIGVPKVGEYKEIFNSDLAKYGGSNIYNGLNPIATLDTYQGCEASMNINVSPLAIHIFKYKK